MKTKLVMAAAFALVAWTRAEAQPNNGADFQRYLEDLRRQAGKPSAADPELRKIIDELYRPNASVGNGSTQDAIRSERRTGKPTGGAWHDQKGRDKLNELVRWLKKANANANAPASPTGAGAAVPKISAHDRRVAENLVLDIEDALRTPRGVPAVGAQPKPPGVNAARVIRGVRIAGGVIQIASAAVDLANGKPAEDVAIETAVGLGTWALLSAADGLVYPALLAAGPVGWVGAVVYTGGKWLLAGYLSKKAAEAAIAAKNDLKSGPPPKDSNRKSGIVQWLNDGTKKK